MAQLHPRIVVVLATILLVWRPTAAQDDWRLHRGWQLLGSGQSVAAANAFGESVQGLPAETRASDCGDGLELGWSIAVATFGADMLRQIASEAAGTDPGDRAQKLLELLFQEDRQAARSWRGLGQSPWQEALVRLLEIYGVPQAQALFHPPYLAVASDGTEFRLSQRRSVTGDDELIVVPPGGPAVRCPITGMDPPSVHRHYRHGCHLALSPNESRLYLASHVAIHALDVARLRAGDYRPLWSFEPAGAAALPVSVAVTADGACVIWANRGYSGSRTFRRPEDRGCGIGVLDARTGQPLSGSVPREFEPRPHVGVNAGLSADGRAIWIPVGVDMGTQGTALPGGATHVPYAVPAFNEGRCAWAALDAASGALLGLEPNPWAPAAPSQPPHPNSLHDYTHRPPDWCPSVPAGLVHCITGEQAVIQVDPRACEIVGQSSTLPRNSRAGAPPGPDWVTHWASNVIERPWTSFAPAVAIQFTPEEFQQVHAAFRALIASPADVQKAASQDSTTWGGRYRVASALLAAAIWGASSRDDRASGEPSEDTIPREWSRHDDRAGLGGDARAWRSLWRAYLRYISIRSAPEPAEKTPETPWALTDLGADERRYFNVPVRFDPGWVAGSLDGKWLYAGNSSDAKWVDYINVATGYPDLAVAVERPGKWFRARDTDRMLLTCSGTGVPHVSGPIVDMRRGCVVSRVKLPACDWAISLGGGAWALVPRGHREHGLWHLDGSSGVIGTGLPFPARWEQHAVMPRVWGTLGISADGRSALVPCGLSPRGGQTAGQPPVVAWAVLDLASGQFKQMLASEDILTEEGWRALQDAPRSPNDGKLRWDVPCSYPPWGGPRWTLTNKGGISLSSARGHLIQIPSTSIGGGAAGGGGTVIIVP